MNKKTMQKHDPFAINDETHCGDCNKTLTDKRGRVASAVFDHGVRCEKCHKLASDVIQSLIDDIEEKEASR